MSASPEVVAAAMERMNDLRDALVRDLSNCKYACARSREWAMVPLEIRMAVMLLAGIDGELGALAKKAWPEFSLKEKETVRVTLRGLHKGMLGTFALRGRSGDE